MSKHNKEFKGLHVACSRCEGLYLLEEDSECQSIRVSHVPLQSTTVYLRALPEYFRQCRSIDKLATDVSEMEIDRGLDRDEIIHFTQPHRGFRTIDNPIVGMGGS